MQATFLITLNILDETEIPSTAEDIHDDLADSGFDVIEVKAWSRPAMDIAQETAFPEPGASPLF